MLDDSRIFAIVKNYRICSAISSELLQDLKELQQPFVSFYSPWSSIKEVLYPVVIFVLHSFDNVFA